MYLDTSRRGKVGNSGRASGQCGLGNMICHYKKTNTETLSPERTLVAFTGSNSEPLCRGVHGRTESTFTVPAFAHIRSESDGAASDTGNFQYRSTVLFRRGSRSKITFNFYGFTLSGIHTSHSTF